MLLRLNDPGLRVAVCGDRECQRRASERKTEADKEQKCVYVCMERARARAKERERERETEGLWGYLCPHLISQSEVNALQNGGWKRQG